MCRIVYIDRLTGKKEEEQVYGKLALEFLYGDSWWSRIFGRILLPLLVKFPYFSQWYGFLQNRPSSARKIRPFIEKYHIEVSEFLNPVESFCSFNDFFCRKLRPEARPLVRGKYTAIIPADGRFLFYQDVSLVDGFVVKGKKFGLEALLGNRGLSEVYKKGAMVIGRLCPVDYHRFHFPCDGIPGESKLLNGYLSSVNPLALKKNVNTFTENKRFLCEIETKYFGRVLMIEIGATNVGSISQIYNSKTSYVKGDEKGFFAFGGSSLILLFEPERILFDEDLLRLSQNHVEVKCLLGQSLGCASFFIDKKE